MNENNNAQKASNCVICYCNEDLTPFKGRYICNICKDEVKTSINPSDMSTEK